MYDVFLVWLVISISDWALYCLSSGNPVVVSHLYVELVVEYPLRGPVQQPGAKYTPVGAFNQQSTLAHLTAHNYPQGGAYPHNMTRKVPLGVNQ